MAGQPFTDIGVFLGAIVVQDRMDGLVVRHLTLELVEKTGEFLMAVTGGIVADNGAGQHTLRGKEGLKPHITKGFKVSNDPMFEEKVTDIVGLYLDPPERAVVLCVDEKSQIQALDRTQPGLPLKKGRAATMTHDYKRHGTTTLFAALDVKSGMVIGECLPRHPLPGSASSSDAREGAREFLRFLCRIDRAVLKPRDVHLMLDNYATHKTPEVKTWLEKHPRFKLHFTPTSTSWLNLVGRFFAEITSKRIRRGSHTSVGDLEVAIYDYLGQHNTKPKPLT